MRSPVHSLYLLFILMGACACMSDEFSWPVDANQARILTAPQRIINVDASRRYGKTRYIAAPKLALTAINKPGSFACYTTPTLAQLDECYQELTEGEHSHLTLPEIKKIRTKPFRIWWRNGSRTEFRQSGNPLALKGRGYSLIVTDEGQDIRGERFARAVVPTIADKRDAAGNYIGEFMVLGQPRGEDWRYRMIVQPATVADAIGFNPSKYASFNLSCYDAWAFQGPRGLQELQDQRHAVGDAVFAEDFECQRLADTGAAFATRHYEKFYRQPEVDVIAPRMQGNGLPFNYFISADLGKNDDPSEFGVFEYGRRNNLGIVDHIQLVDLVSVPLGTDHAVQASRLATLSTRWNSCPVAIDATGGADGNRPLVKNQTLEHYRRTIPTVSLYEWLWNGSNKNALVEDMALMNELGRWCLPLKFTKVFQQIRDYRKYKNSRGFWCFKGKDNTHDDCVPMVMLGLHFINQGRVGPAGLTHRGPM